MANKTRRPALQTLWIVGILAMVCCLLWGSAPSAIKTGYALYGIESQDTATQIAFAGCRFSLAGILALIIARITRRRAVLPKKSSIWKIGVLALLQTVIQYVFYYVGVAHTTGVKTAIITGSNTIFAILIASLIFRQEKLNPRKIAGCILGFAGVVLVNVVGRGGFGLDFTLAGEGFVFFSNIAYACSSVVIHEFGKTEDPILLTGWQFLTGGIVMIIIGNAMGGRVMIRTLPQLGILLYLAVVASVAYTIWSLLLKYNPVSTVTIFGFMNPIFGVILSALLLREGSSIHVVTIAALALVSAGIYIVNRSTSAERDENDGPEMDRIPE